MSTTSKLILFKVISKHTCYSDTSTNAYRFLPFSPQTTTQRSIRRLTTKQRPFIESPTHKTQITHKRYRQQALELAPKIINKERKLKLEIPNWREKVKWAAVQTVRDCVLVSTTRFIYVVACKFSRRWQFVNVKHDT